MLHCATQTVYEPFFTQMFLPVWASGASGSDMELSRALAVYLSSTSMCERSDDDKALNSGKPKISFRQLSARIWPVYPSIAAQASKFGSDRSWGRAQEASFFEVNGRSEIAAKMTVRP